MSAEHPIKPPRRSARVGRSTGRTVAKEELDARRMFAAMGVKRFSTVQYFRTCHHYGWIGTRDKQLCWHCVATQRKEATKEPRGEA